MNARRRWPIGVALPVLLIALVTAMTIGLMTGPVRVAPMAVWRVVFERIAGGHVLPVAPPFQATIVWDLRLPRVLLAVVVGAGLAVVGTAMQAIVRNPLADPYLLGTSSGAALGAVSVMLFFGGSMLTIAIAAFSGAAAASAIVYVLAADGHRLTTARLVLSGVATGSFCAAITNVLIFKAPGAEQTRSALFWLLGGVAAARWDFLGLPAIVMISGTALLVMQSRALNALSVGEETATTLGVDGDRVRRQVFLLTSLVTGVLVAVSGGIGFVGLMAPHAGRFLVGNDHRRLLPVAALGGAAFLVLADVAARTVAAPQEVPIGIITALIGTPCFVWLMRRRVGRAR